MLLSSLIVVLPLIPPPPLSLACSLRGCSVGLFAPPRLHCRRRCVGRSVGRRAPSSAMAVGLAASEVAVLNHSLHPSLPSSPLSIVIGVCAVYTRRDWKERIPPTVPPSKVLALDLSKLSLALCTDVGSPAYAFPAFFPDFSSLKISEYAVQLCCHIVTYDGSNN